MIDRRIEVIEGFGRFIHLDNLSKSGRIDVVFFSYLVSRNTGQIIRVYPPVALLHLLAVYEIGLNSPPEQGRRTDLELVHARGQVELPKQTLSKYRNVKEAIDLSFPNYFCIWHFASFNVLE